MTSHSLPSQNLARPLLSLPTTTPPRRPRRCHARAGLIDVALSPHSSIDSQVEQLGNALALFTAALDVRGAHFERYALSLFRRDGRKSLATEQVDAVPFVSEIGL